MKIISKTITPRKTLILGASGLLGKAIFNRFLQQEDDYPDKVHTIAWREIGKPDICADPHLLAEFLEDRLGDMTDTDVIIAGGLIGSTDSDQLMYSNLVFPQNLIRAVWRHPGSRFMTFGTIHERFEAAISHNLYFMTKYLLSQWISEFSAQHPPTGRILHLRLHTLYGLPLHSRMFLGQIAEALKSDSPFRMSSGEQIREYHHVEDIAECVYRLCRRKWDFGPILEINSGEAVRLRDLATAIFREFNREYLLRIGDISAGAGENTCEIFHRTDRDVLPCSRKAIDGVLDTLRRYLHL